MTKRTWNDFFSSLSMMPSFSPVVTVDEFASMSGLSSGAVRKAIERGFLPAYRIGNKRIMINILALSADCMGVELPAIDIPSKTKSELWDEDADEYMFQYDKKQAVLEGSGLSEDDIEKVFLDSKVVFPSSTPDLSGISTLEDLDAYIKAGQW